MSHEYACLKIAPIGRSLCQSNKVHGGMGRLNRPRSLLELIHLVGVLEIHFSRSAEGRYSAYSPNALAPVDYAQNYCALLGGYCI